MILTISEAARRAGIARSTLYEMKLRGDISFTKSLAGKQGIELSELARLFPQVLSDIPTNPTRDDMKRQVASAHEINDLKEKVERLERELIEEKKRVLKSEERLDLLLHITQEQSKKLLVTHQPTGFFKRLFGFRDNE
jgi:predicted site-specific integrase-resolvase